MPAPLTNSPLYHCVSLTKSPLYHCVSGDLAQARGGGRRPHNHCKKIRVSMKRPSASFVRVTGPAAVGKSWIINFLDRAFPKRLPADLVDPFLPELTAQRVVCRDEYGGSAENLLNEHPSAQVFVIVMDEDAVLSVPEQHRLVECRLSSLPSFGDGWNLPSPDQSAVCAAVLTEARRWHSVSVNDAEMFHLYYNG